MRYLGQEQDLVRAPGRDLHRIDTADEIVRRHQSISASRYAISDNPAGVGAVLFANAGEGASLKPGNLGCHVFGFRCWGARTKRTDKARSFPGRVGGPGMSSFVAADEACAWECEGPHEMVALFLGKIFLSQLAAEVFGIDGKSVQYHEAAFHFDEAGTQLGKTIERQLRSAEPISTLELDAWGQLVGLHVLRHYSSIGDRAAPSPSGGLTPTKLQTAVDYVMSNMSLQLRLVDVAECVGMSQFAFARGFKNATGMSPHQFLTRARIERAQDLLLSGEQPISHIASSVGFVDQSHLTTQFRKMLGITPARYRSVCRS